MSNNRISKKIQSLKDNFNIQNYISLGKLNTQRYEKIYEFFNTAPNWNNFNCNDTNVHNIFLSN